MRIGLLTTLDTNIGDDFIRTGLWRVIRDVLPNDEPVPVSINKHRPLSVYWRVHPRRLARYVADTPLRHLGVDTALNRIGRKIAWSKWSRCDAIIQCGTPVLWPKCRRAEWAEPIWYGVVRPFSRSRPVLNLGAGSCYPWERQPATLAGDPDEQYVADITSFTSITTARDVLAAQLFASVGCKAEVIPCPALLALVRNTGMPRRDR